MSAQATAATPLYLVDASMYVFRAWHSMPNEFHDADGWPTNAVHGFARFLLELLERERPKHIGNGVLGVNSHERVYRQTGVAVVEHRTKQRLCSHGVLRIVFNRVGQRCDFAETGGDT